MVGATAFLRKNGEVCTIARTPSVTSRIMKERTRRSGDPSTRDGDWRGIILADSVLVSGDVFDVGGDTYLTQSVVPHGDYLEWDAVKCTATVEHRRAVESVDDVGTITHTWTLLASTVAWGQIVTAHLRLADPGLLDAARYVFQVPKVLGVVALDRIVYGGKNHQVESIDDVAMAGVVRLQLGVDVR